MATISTVDIRKHLSDVVNAARYNKERVVLTRHNKPVVTIVPIEDYELLEALEDHLDLEDALADEYVAIDANLTARGVGNGRVLRRGYGRIPLRTRSRGLCLFLIIKMDCLPLPDGFIYI
ncbi:unnamed protein product [marine sediment metagenome]|uniref:Antitoxin n=1 Tax=marine sediment metagenome TaxID=412755 RepID=X0VPM9_9ZZZZ